MAAFRTAAISLLIAFYAFVGYSVLNPRVSDEYRAYYIARETQEWRPPRYPAALEEGIDFSHSAYPDFVRSTAGISFHEDWGRWTDARLSPAARIVFDRKFSGQTCVVLKAAPAVAQKGKPVVFRFGRQERSVRTSEESVQSYEVEFKLDAPSDVLEIVPSEPRQAREWDPTNSDSRILGLALQRLVVAAGPCKGTGLSARGQ